jgi:hypothetical protein
VSQSEQVSGRSGPSLRESPIFGSMARFANKYHCVVNQNAGENFEVGIICLPKQESNLEPFG